VTDFDAIEVKSALSTRAVLEHYGWKAKRSGDEYESTACPERADHSRRAFVVNANSGRWQCFPCGTSGDLFDFVGLVERLAMPGDFRAVLAKAAEIAGVAPSSLSAEERRQRHEQWQAKRREDEARDREERRRRDSEAIPKATSYWSELSTKDSRGFDYLCSRRVQDVILLDDVVRFDPKHNGSPAVRLYSSTGAIRNVVVRRLPELGEPKTPGLYQCPSAGTLIDPVTRIEPERDVVVTEGVMDTVTARLAWRDAVVLGAHGAGNLPKVAQVAAPLVARARSRMLLVPHSDEAGHEKALEACRHALDAGLSVRKGTLAIVKHGEKDLNDAWQRGWRAA